MRIKRDMGSSVTRKLILLSKLQNKMKSNSVKLIDELFLPAITRLNYKLEKRMTMKD